MKINKQGFSLVIVLVSAAVVILISSVAIFVIRQQTDNQEVSNNTNLNKNISTQEKATNQQTVNTIENEIKDINLENELPSADLEQDINSLL